MADQNIDLSPLDLEHSGEMRFDVEHTSWSTPIPLFNEPTEIEQISLTFDQLGRPIVFYRINGNELMLRWYDSSIGQNVTTLIGYGTDPIASFNDPTNIEAAYTDVVLHYVRKNRLFARVQRDRFLVEYPVFGNQSETVARLSFNTDFKDLTGQPWTVNGNVTINQLGFFGAGAEFSGGYLVATPTEDWAFEKRIATISFRLFPKWTFDSSDTAFFICGNWSTFSLGSGWGIYYRSNGRLEVRINDQTFYTTNFVFTDGLWSAVTVVLNDIDLHIFKDGVLLDTYDISSLTVSQTRAIQIGRSPELGNPGIFTLDGFYILKGVAQYTSNYEVPKIPQPLWVGLQQTSVNGLVFAADFRAGFQPWVTRAPWNVLANTRRRYLPEHNDVFLDLTYAGSLCGLEGTSWFENVLFYLGRFSIRFRYVKPDIPLVDQTEEIIYNFHGGHLYPTGFMFGIKNKGYPFFRWLADGIERVVVSPIFFPTDTVHEVLFTREFGIMKVYVNGIYVGEAEMAETVNIPQPPVIGYRYQSTSASTENNPFADKTPFRGFLSAIEIYNGRVVQSANYDLNDFPILRQPDSNSSYLSGDGLRLIGAGYRMDNRFQIEYRKPLDNALSAKNRYVIRALEYYKFPNPLVHLGPGIDINTPFVFNVLIEDFEHSTSTLDPIVIVGDLQPSETRLVISVADVKNETGEFIREYFTAVPSEFSLSVIPNFSNTEQMTVGSRTLKVVPYRELIIVSNGVQLRVMLTKDFGRGYWEFQIGRASGVIKCDGIIVGTYTSNLPAAPLSNNPYGALFSIRKGSDTIVGLKRLIASELSLSGAWLRTVLGQSSGKEVFFVTTADELSIVSESSESTLNIVGGKLKRWI